VKEIGGKSPNVNLVMYLETQNLKSKGLEFDPERHCAFCRSNGSSLKHFFYFAYNRRAKICVKCQGLFQWPQDLTAWLTENAIYDKNGKLVNFKPYIIQVSKPASSSTEAGTPFYAKTNFSTTQPEGHSLCSMAERPNNLGKVTKNKKKEGVIDVNRNN